MAVHNMQRREQRLSEALSQWQDILEVTEACKTPKEVVTCGEEVRIPVFIGEHFIQVAVGNSWFAVYE